MNTDKLLEHLDDVQEFLPLKRLIFMNMAKIKDGVERILQPTELFTT